MMTEVCLRNKMDVSDISLFHLNFQQTDSMIEYYNEKVWLIPRTVPENKLKIY